MRSRAMRVVCGVFSVLGIAAAALFVANSERELAARRAVLRAFERQSHEATDAVADLRAAQQAYVAPGQAADFWTAKVDATLTRVDAALSAMDGTTTSGAAKEALDEAAGASGAFAKIDLRVRQYVGSAAQLMAADIIFSEGAAAAGGIARHVEEARLAERLSADALEASHRRIEAAALGAAAALALLVTVILVPRGRDKTASAVAASGLSHTAAASEPGDLMLRPPDAKPGDWIEGDRSAAVTAPSRLTSLDEIGPPAVPALRTAAQLCTQLARVTDPNDLGALLTRAAEVLEASGLVVWLAADSGTELRPAFAHGYGPDILTRMPAVARTAQNAVAAAFRSEALQVVQAQAGASNGAIAAPVLSTEGCLGVLSVEVRAGGEHSDTLQALAAILAAQLAAILSSAPASDQPRASAGAAS